MHPLINKEKQRLARRYRNDNLKISIISLIITVIFLAVLLYLNISKNFVEVLENHLRFRPLQVFIYFATLYLIFSLISLPLSFTAGYIIEHKYGFSTQDFKGWFQDWIKSFFVSFILGVIVLEVIYLITPISTDLWWLWLSIIMMIFSVILSNLFPILILPLFYKTSPIANEDLKRQITEVANKADMNIRGIYTINLSSKTTKANAAVTGLGNTKRILLGDNLLEKYTEDEVVSALAHEITHYQEHHVWWLILWQSIMTLVMFYIFYRIYPFLYDLAGFEKISDIDAFPLFVLIFFIISYVFRPLGSAISRYYEKRADIGTLNLTRNPDAFIHLIAKLCNEQLTIAYPNPIVEWYKYSHPSPGRRIGFGEEWKESRKEFF